MRATRPPTHASVPVPLVEGTVYDAGVPTGMGGNTVVETKPDGTFVQQWVALSGTIRNCAGGETPCPPRPPRHARCAQPQGLRSAGQDVRIWRDTVDGGSRKAR